MKIRLPALVLLMLGLGLFSGLALASSGVWVQSNVSGFGDADNVSVSALAPFDGHLYAGAGPQLWRKTGTGSWSIIMSDGFGNPNTEYVSDLFEFNAQLYSATRNYTDGGQVWRSADASMWNPISLTGFDPTNGELVRFGEFGGAIFVSTWSFTDTHGAEVWRSTSGDSGDWTQVASNGFDGDVDNKKIVSFEAFNGHLYAGTDNVTTGAEVWRSNNGTSWSQVNADGFGDPYNMSVTLEDFDGYLYAGTYNWWTSDDPGSELWRCQTCDGADWLPVPIAKGFGDTENRSVQSMQVFDSALHAVTYNAASGVEVWRSADGTTWKQVNDDGFGDSENRRTYWDNAVTVFDSSLYVGTWNQADGGEVWVYPRFQVYLPVGTKGY